MFSLLKNISPIYLLTYLNYQLSCHENCVDYELIPIDSNLIETLHNRLRDHVASGKAKIGFTPSSAGNMHMLVGKPIKYI